MVVFEGKLSGEGGALVKLYYSSSVSVTTMNHIIFIMKDPLFRAENVEKNFEEMLSLTEVDHPSLVLYCFNIDIIFHCFYSETC